MRKYGTTEKIIETKTATEMTKTATEIVSATPENPVVLEPVDPVGGVGASKCDDPACCGDCD